jgi:cobalt/nickel transport system permease protein
MSTLLRTDRNKGGTVHIPDGFIDGGTSAGATIVAVAGLGLAANRARVVLDDRQIPLVGLVSAFVFAAQMLNFPVASGTSGHLLGGVLAAVLVGPWLGALCVAVVLSVQALLFADGGLSALGLNILNMALITAVLGYGVFLALRFVLARFPGGIVVAAGVAAGLGVVLSSIAFSIEYAIGGTEAASTATVTGAMVGVHVLIGIGEGLITAMTVGAVLATRPDLVYGAHVRTRERRLSASAAPGLAGVTS